MKNILIMVDVQNGFVKNSYSDAVLNRIVDLLSRNLFDSVIATKYVNEKGSIISRFMGWNALCTEQEQALRPEIAKFAHRVLEKDIYSSMTDEMYEALKEANDGTLPEYVFVLGFDTECCVAMTATELFESDIRPFVLTEYCGSHDGDVYHNAGLVSMEHLIGPDFLVSGRLKSPEDRDQVIESIMKRMAEYEEEASR